MPRPTFLALGNLATDIWLGTLVTGAENGSRHQLLCHSKNRSKNYKKITTRFFLEGLFESEESEIEISEPEDNVPEKV